MCRYVGGVAGAIVSISNDQYGRQWGGEGEVAGLFLNFHFVPFLVFEFTVIRREIMELRDQLTATLTPEQRAIFTELDDLTVAEGVALQDGMARALCGCPECKGLAVAT